MKFYITTSSFPCQRSPCNAVFIEKRWGSNIYGIEINSLEQLVALKDELQRNITLRCTDSTLERTDKWEADYTLQVDDLIED